MVPTFAMAQAENSPKNYTALLQSVAGYLSPFLQDGEEPSVPWVTWFTAYNAALLMCKVFQGTDFTDWQKNRLLYDFLGEAGKQRVGPHADVAHMEAESMPHDAF